MWLPDQDTLFSRSSWTNTRTFSRSLRYKTLSSRIQQLILPLYPLSFSPGSPRSTNLNRGAASFLRKYPHIFHVLYDPVKSQPFFRLTDVAMEISRQEALAINATLYLVVYRLARLLSTSISKSIPLRAVFEVWRQLGLPDDFEDSVISKNPHIFRLRDGHEPNTYILELVQEEDKSLSFEAAVEQWRVVECYKEDCSINRTVIQFSFKHSYPPGMRLSKNFKAKVKEWQRLPYVGPYEDVVSKKKNKFGVMGIKKRAVAITHEFLSLTVEKMVEVEKISHFQKMFWD